VHTPRNRRAAWVLSIASCVVLLATVGAGAAAAGTDTGAASDNEVAGRLIALWGDSPLGSHGGARLAWDLVTDAGDHLRLDLSDELLRDLGGPLRANGSRVEARLEPGEPERSRRVIAIARAAGGEALAGGGLTAVIGSQPWISILCKFNDVADQPHDLSYFQGMFANSPGRLDHYWREVSYNAATVAGSTAVGWVVLPHPLTHYVPTPGNGCMDGISENDADLEALFADCTAAVDAVVDFSRGGTGGYVGINLMFNDDLDGCAWGGGHFATLDGVAKIWRTTWEPPWGYANVTVTAHEMGHGFGLPHSNNWDDDGWPYDNSWDVMSDTWSYAAVDPVYGVVGKHVGGLYKDLLGWIPPSQKLVAATNGTVTVVIDDLALASTSNYRLAEIPVANGFDSWTVEVRSRTGLYDGQLPSKAVIIHQIDLSRAEPAWCHDSDVPPGEAADGEGSMWRVGETFEDAAHGVKVTVDAETAQGFRVTIRRLDANMIFADGFESGTTGLAWLTPP
jgi:M6 family metalloprotease-like protein